MQMQRLLVCLLTGVSATIAGLTQVEAADNAQVWEPVPSLVAAAGNGMPPGDAIILFDGSNLDAWHSAETEQDATWEILDGVATVRRGMPTIKTRQAFGDIQLHIEWRPSAVVVGESQGRGNSGLFLQSQYEVQILDSWENPTYVNGQAGAIYLQHPPLVNAARRPGEWQYYDIVFTAPRFAADGSVDSAAYVTVFHNGVLVQNHVEIQGATYTPAPAYAVRCTPYGETRVQDCSGKMPLSLQSHGQEVSYRNVWVREL